MPGEVCDQDLEPVFSCISERRLTSRRSVIEPVNQSADTVPHSRRAAVQQDSEASFVQRRRSSGFPF